MHRVILQFFSHTYRVLHNDLTIIFLAFNNLTVYPIAIMSSLLYSLDHLIFSHVHSSTCSDLHSLPCRFMCHLPILNKYRLLKE